MTEAFAQISASGTVTFSDPPLLFKGRSRLRVAFCTNTDQDGWWPGSEEDVYAGASGPWAEDSMFASSCV
ncbi:hypothetical protein MIND_00087500 [Mycena indigotica]|uniref:Uncharacterized protein n=1 Tax=Mycena indigotica TaxID=2126181 RepID=A0A8H6TBY4_9AGAR|nr:uncharacterized protein MIND_00087500 [Mycena indigotica]KAF7315718.1 hypothetical protein MIND_00087500 [Mycena indigotica]